MIQLNSTTELVRLTTGAAGGSIVYHAPYADNNAGTLSYGHQANAAAITTATTTTIVPSPGAGVVRVPRSIYLNNTSATVSVPVTVEHFDGTNAILLKAVTLLPGEALSYSDEGEWKHYDANGAEYSYSAPARPNLGVSGTIAETFPRELLNEVNTSALTSGTLRFQAIYLQAGQTVTNISIYSATTAAATPTNGFFALYDRNRNLLANCANFTTEAWAANSVKTKAMTTPYKVPTSGLYFIGIMIAASTVPTLIGHTARTATTVAGAGDVLQGNTASTGLTTTLPATAGAITAATSSFYAAVS
jgi:hypothetical protein